MLTSSRASGGRRTADAAASMALIIRYKAIPLLDEVSIEDFLVVLPISSN